ncbi:DUF177 domain-containing protein [Phenylobacterium sp.]|jgi:uncharacterized metal-binding protein YceD (DUF177 family)|uniref:YceD family protein n=1 Tax=Phenylobacterium sp. TaxID=1871053 RepID=UPI002F42FAE2
MNAWGQPLRLADLARGPVRLSLAPDAAQRAEIAGALGVKSLPALTAEVQVAPWLDGAALTGRIDAQVEQVCGVTLDPFVQPVSADFEVRVVPAGSPHAPGDDGGELTLDLDAPDPPDVLQGDEIDVAAYVVEHLALELDPFPRKPDAAFEFASDPAESSPFAALKGLKTRHE